MTGFLRACINVLKDRRGVAAVEFAFVAPLLIALYFTTIEISQAIDTNKKVGRLASMVGDLVTQQQTVTKADMRGILDVSNTVLFPYSRSKATVTITAIEVTDEATPKTKVVWSYRKLPNGSFQNGYAKDSLTTLPASLTVAGSFLIRVEADLRYYPILLWSAEAKADIGLAAAFDKLEMGESYLLRPRRSTRIPCEDC
ncbi:MAG: pilus assembly protein [Rhizobiaceae bacterium]|nr:pilus assembly protein [Rhizobiaceae bacterium]MCV0405031.1 pilus assembly protein [Rhizobiaceae bacterium]